MQTIQFKVDDNYLNIVLTLLENLKIDTNIDRVC